jgi:hypothetical protein
MKKIHISLTLLLVALAGCTDEFLEERPESFLSPQSLYTSEAGALAGLNGAYAALKLQKGGRAYLIGIIGTDEAQLTFDEAGVADRLGLDAYDGNLNAQNPWVAWMWNAVYFGIDRANNVLEYVPALQMDETRKNRILGEARFLRALNYFYAVQLFGPVPLRTAPSTSVNDLNFPRASEAEIYAQIIEDLEFAENNLLARYTGPDVGRATTGAAKTLLAKVYLSAPAPIRDYARAAAKAKEVYDAKTYALETDFAQLFVPANENGKESIFEIQFFFPDQIHGLGIATGTRALPFNILGGGFAAYLPTDSMYNSFLPGDKRVPATFRTEFFDATGKKVTSATNPEYLKPYVKKYEDPSATPASNSAKNVYVLRYADLVLMYAEALNETGQTPAATDLVNEVRLRAGIPELAGLDQAGLRSAILRERLWELAFEGWRWYDLKRTGTLVERATLWNPRARVNISEKNYLYPLPINEINTNQGIGPDDQNPGYF